MPRALGLPEKSMPFGYPRGFAPRASNEFVSLSDIILDSPLTPDMDEEGNEEAGWQLARRGIHRALNNEVEEAQDLLKAEVDSSGCPQAQAGFCFIAFMVSTRNTGAAGRAARGYGPCIYLSTAAPVTFAKSKPGTNSIAFDLHFDPQQSYARLGGEAVSLAVSCSDDRGRKWASSSGGGGAVMRCRPFRE